MTPAVETRFWQKVEFDPNGGCWLWSGSLTAAGYGKLGLRHPRRVYPQARRLAYEQFVGPIPDGQELRCLCGVRPCVNPAHAAPMTHRNVLLHSGKTTTAKHAAKTHCPQGHPYIAENTYIVHQGRQPMRRCRICSLEQHNRWRRRKVLGLGK